MLSCFRAFCRAAPPGFVQGNEAAEARERREEKFVLHFAILAAEQLLATGLSRPYPLAGAGRQNLFPSAPPFPKSGSG